MPSIRTFLLETLLFLLLFHFSIHKDFFCKRIEDCIIIQRKGFVQQICILWMAEMQCIMQPIIYPSKPALPTPFVQFRFFFSLIKYWCVICYWIQNEMINIAFDCVYIKFTMYFKSWFAFNNFVTSQFSAMFCGLWLASTYSANFCLTLWIVGFIYRTFQACAGVDYYCIVITINREYNKWNWQSRVHNRECHTKGWWMASTQHQIWNDIERFNNSNR